MSAKLPYTRLSAALRILLSALAAVVLFGLVHAVLGSAAPAPSVLTWGVL